jgi:hypothetical protein
VATDQPAAETPEVPAETTVLNTLETEVSNNVVGQSETVSSKAPVDEPTVDAKAVSESETAKVETSVRELIPEAEVVDELAKSAQVSDTLVADNVSVQVSVSVAQTPASSLKLSDAGILEDSQMESVPEVEDKTDGGGANTEESGDSTVDGDKLDLKYKYSEGLFCAFFLNHGLL